MSSISIHRWPRALAVLLLLASGVSSAAAFTLHVPVRDTPLPPTKAVRITLETGGPVAGSSVIINGVTRTVPTPGTDFVSFGPDFARLIDGGNTVEIKLYLRSMVDSANPCQYASGAVTKDYPITFTASGGAATVNGYRLTSYTIPGPEACNCASTRVLTEAPYFTAAPPGDDLGRNDMDLALILDQSGSMEWNTDGAYVPGAGITRWDSLKWATDGFITMWATEGQGSGTTRGRGLSGDRLSMITFSGSGVPVLNGTNYFTLRGSAGSYSSAHPWAFYNTTLGGMAPIWNGTALGSAIAAGENRKVDDRDTAFLLMTDGEQNQPPMVEYLAGGWTAVSLDGGPPTALKDRCVPIHSVVLGVAPGSEASNLLNAISLQTAGLSGEATPSTLDITFIDRLVKTLAGYTIMGEFAGTLAPPPTPGVAARPATTAMSQVSSLPVTMDSTVRDALIVLSWSPFDSGTAPMDLQVKAPGGAAAVLTSRVASTGKVIARVDLPASGKPGDWTINVLAGAVSQPVTYHLTVVANEKALGLETRFDGTSHVTGEPLKVQTYVALKGRPVEGKAKLDATVERPTVALGTLLHDSSLAVPPFKPGKGQPANAYEAKLVAAMKDPKVRDQVRKTKKEKLDFKHAGHGRYELTLNNVDVPGTYRFNISLEIPMPGGERLRRIDRIETVVAVAPTAPIVAVKDLGAGKLGVTVTPRDRMGNFSGPGKRLGATISKGQVVGVTDDKQTGDYLVQLADVQGDAILGLSLNGRPLGSKPLSQWGKK